MWKLLWQYCYSILCFTWLKSKIKLKRISGGKFWFQNDMSCIHFQKLDVCKTISKPFKPLKRVGLSVRPAGGITIRREEQLQTNLNPVFWLHIPLKQQSLMGGSLAPQSTFGSVWGHFWLPRLECCYWHLHGWRVDGRGYSAQRCSHNEESASPRCEALP